ncbi:MAG: hypothetical protein EOP04_16675 [Proteobacteria bacterium]|nr:MAG: hypothetical protein EOP04_16675 [Pseudomonadota bacterium]
MKISRFSLVFALMLASACGSETKSKKAQANDFFAGQLQSPAIVQCKQENHFFNLADAECVSDLNLAAWVCDRNGLLVRIKSDDNSSILSQINAKSLETLDDKIKDGFEFNQCGESTTKSTIHVQLIKKSTDGSTASLQSGEVVFILPSAAP